MAIPSGAFPVAPAGGTSIYPTGRLATPCRRQVLVPEIWSGKLVEKFYASTVLAAISNTDYEGEIKNKGDRVKIRTKPTITIHNYDADGLLGPRPSDRWHGGTLHRQRQVLLAHPRRRDGNSVGPEHPVHVVG